MAPAGRENRADDRERSSLIVQMALAVIFLTLAIWFLFGAGEAIPSLPEPTQVSEEQLATTPARRALTDPPLYRNAGFDYECQECHRLFSSMPETDRVLMRHRNIELDHGLNDRCFNCHHNEDRNLLALQGGETVTYSNSPQLCGKCHGPTFRDWQQGMHGRTIPSATEPAGRVRLKCTECHDPHAPAMAGMELLPGPNTLRMGDPSPIRHHTDESPLRHWSTHAEQQQSSEGEH